MSPELYFLLKAKPEMKCFGNFIMFTQSSSRKNIHYTIFFPKNDVSHINITGTRSFFEMERSFELLQNYLHSSLTKALSLRGHLKDCPIYSVDNVTAKGHFPPREEHIQASLIGWCDYLQTFLPMPPMTWFSEIQMFPALRINIEQLPELFGGETHHHHRGYIFIFSSLKFCVLQGFQDIEVAKLIFLKTKRLIQDYVHIRRLKDSKPMNS